MDSRRRSRSPVRGRRSPPRHGRGGPGGGGGRRGGMSFRPGCLVYMASLPFDVRWMDLKNMILEKAGEVNFVELLQTKDGRPKGTAVVEFKSRADAEKCIENMNKMEIGNRTMEVSAIREPERFFESLRLKAGIDFLGLGDRAGGGAPRGGVGGGGNRGLEVGQFETYGIPPQILREARIEGPLLNRVFVAGLPFHVQASKVRDLFSIAGKVEFVETLLDKEGAGTGRSLITFRHPVEAVQAILLLNRQRYYDRPIEVKFDRHDPPKQRAHNEFPMGLAGIGKGFGPNGEADPNIVERMVRTGCLPAAVLDGGAAPPVVAGGGMGVGNMMAGGGGMPGGMGDAAMVGMGGGGGRREDGFAGSMENLAAMGGSGFGGSSRVMDMGGSGSNGGMFSAGGAMSTGSGAGLGGVWNNAMGSSESFGGSSGGMGGMAIGAPGGASMLGGGDMGGGGGSGFGGGLGGGSYMQMGGADSGLGYGRYDRGISRDRSPPPMIRGGGGGGGGRMRPGGEPGSKIQIRNLPMDFPWQELKDLARKAGDVEFVECQDGIGKVQYRTRSDAEKAQRYFDNYLFEGRYLDVRAD